VQLPVPLHAPPHPPNTDPSNGVADSATTVPLVKLAEHPLPQLIPAGLLVTDPAPLPASATDNVKFPVVLNVAVTDFAALIVTTQLPVPVHAPPHPANVDPLPGVSLSVTDASLPKFAVQLPVDDPPVQLIPAGELVTVPVPVPASVTVSANVVVVLNVAVTDSAALIVTVQTPTPAQPDPLHPANALPLPAVAVSVTSDPVVKFAAQVLGHKIPAGLLDTVPVPVPASATVNAEVRLNVAWTSSAPVIETVHVPVPVQPSPNHPANTEFAPAVAVSVTCVPVG
jgi:hypothetical protein